MKKRILTITAIMMTAAAIIAATIQTLNVRLGEVIYQYATDQVGRMELSGSGTVATILNKVFNLNEVDEMYLDESEVTDNMVYVDYDGTTAQVRVAGNIAQYINVVANGAHIAITQSSDYPGADMGEITYVLSGTSSNGSFWMDGSYKASFELNGVNLTNPDSAAINIRDGKRIAVTLVDGTTNALTDGADGSQKGCFAVKGHTEFTGGGSLTITGNANHGFWGKEYVEFKKKFTGSITVNKAVGDGFNVNQYIKMNGGTITISGVGDDGMQLSQSTDDAGNVEDDADNTGVFTMAGGTLNITTTAAGAKGIKAAVDYVMTGGTVTINQSGGYTYDGVDPSYVCGIKTKGNINITGGTVNITSTADGGRGLGADGTINIDETSATTTVDIKANGAGGVLEQNASGSGGGGTETPKSYKVYINYASSSGGYSPGGGGSNLWKNFYLYRASDNTQVATLTSSVTKSSGYSSYTFYYYDFKASSSETYYFKSDNYTSGGGWGGGTSYTIQSETFSVPDGSDVYYQMTRDGYSTSGTTRTFTLNNVTSTYGGSNESSEDNGESYNASGIKADGNVTIGGGTITIANSGAMSKSIKTKATATINGGNITLTPSGALKVISNDASYSTGIKALDCVINGGTIGMTVSGQCGKGISVGNNTTSNGILTVNGGTLTVNLTSGATGYGSSSAGNRHTAKGLKSDGHMYLNAGNITVSTVTAGAKAIKVNGNYYQGTSDGNGPTLTLSTTGGRYGASGSSYGGGMGKTTGQGGAAKGVKAEGTCTLYGGETVITTAADGGEGLEGKNGVTIAGGKHYIKAYDDGISSDGKVVFDGGITVCYSFGNDAVDSNYGGEGGYSSSGLGAITIGNGAIFAYSTKGGAEEGFDCDNNNKIQITGYGYAISAGGNQGGGGWGGSSSNSSIGSAVQGYYLGVPSGFSSVTANRYYTICDSSNSPLVSFCCEASVSSNSLSLLTAKGMTSNSTYYIKYSTSAPTNCTDSWHGFYLGGSFGGSLSQVATFTAK